ncbi:hypothetical protein MUP29_04380, partial [bacterium]|nr:hypothetical protein [bacterium]
MRKVITLLIIGMVFSLVACGGGGGGGGDSTPLPIMLISVDSAGTEGNLDSHNPSISSSGRYVAFDSNATNLITSDGNTYTDIFVHDTQTGITSRVSVSAAGT